MSQCPIDKIKKNLQQCLDAYRFEHTLGVMYTAAALAMRYGTDIEQAMTAGLLHDCAKGLSSEEKIALCKKHHLPISDAEVDNPELLHAKLGACLAKAEYGIVDRAILDAIACHTTGKPDMTLLDKIIYIADYMEPGRNRASNLDEVRKLAFVDLDRCLYMILEATLSYLKSRERAVDPVTEQTYLFYKQLLNP